MPWADANAAGALFGEKLILNEFVAYSNLNDYLAEASERTRAIVTFALCGFANLSSIAILLGGLGVSGAREAGNHRPLWHPRGSRRIVVQL